MMALSCAAAACRTSWRPPLRPLAAGWRSSTRRRLPLRGLRRLPKLSCGPCWTRPPGAGQSGRSVLVGGLRVVGLIAGAERLGTLVWAPEVTADRISDIDRRLLERAAVVASLLQFFKRNLAAAEAQVRGELLEELLPPSPTTYSSLASRAHRLRYQPQEQHGVMVAHIGPAHRRRLAAVASDLAAARHGLSTMREGAAALVLPAHDVAVTARQVCRSMTLQLSEPVTVGAAGPVSDPAQIPAAFTEAAACMNALLTLGRGRLRYGRRPGVHRSPAGRAFQRR
jgi:hypothetical protein